jgi:hypothetical protein
MQRILSKFLGLIQKGCAARRTPQTRAIFLRYEYISKQSGACIIKRESATTRQEVRYTKKGGRYASVGYYILPFRNRVRRYNDIQTLAQSKQQHGTYKINRYDHLARVQYKTTLCGCDKADTSHLGSQPSVWIIDHCDMLGIRMPICTPRVQTRPRIAFFMAHRIPHLIGQDSAIPACQKHVPLLCVVQLWVCLHLAQWFEQCKTIQLVEVHDYKRTHSLCGVQRTHPCAAPCACKRPSETQSEHH